MKIFANGVDKAYCSEYISCVGITAPNETPPETGRLDTKMTTATTTAKKAKIELVVDGVTVYTKQTNNSYVQAMIHRNPNGEWSILASSTNASASWGTLAKSALGNSSVRSYYSTPRNAQDSRFLLCRIVDGKIVVSSAQFDAESYRIAIVMGIRNATYMRCADYTYTATKVESEFVYQNIQLANTELRQKFNRQITGH